MSTEKDTHLLSVNLNLDDWAFVKQVRAEMDKHGDCTHTITQATVYLLSVARKSNWREGLKRA